MLSEPGVLTPGAFHNRLANDILPCAILILLDRPMPMSSHMVLHVGNVNGAPSETKPALAD